MGQREEIVEHSFTCPECRQITAEMLKEDREALKDDIRFIIKDEIGTSKIIRDKLDRVENVQYWQNFVLIVLSLTIIYLFIR